MPDPLALVSDGELLPCARIGRSGRARVTARSGGGSDPRRSERAGFRISRDFGGRAGDPARDRLDRHRVAVLVSPIAAVGRRSRQAVSVADRLCRRRAGLSRPAPHHRRISDRSFSPRWRTSFAIGIDLLILVAAAVGYVSLDLLSISATSNTPILEINAAWLILPLTVGLVLVALFVIERLVYDCAPRAVIFRPASWRCWSAPYTPSASCHRCISATARRSVSCWSLSCWRFCSGFPSALRCCWVR